MPHSAGHCGSGVEGRFPLSLEEGGSGSMRIAVLLTCYNRVETTLRCLRGLFMQELPAECKLEVYLVDDASPDQTGNRVRDEFPQVNVIPGGGNLFWCKGMRLAWDNAIASGIDYDYYLWLNDDVVLKSNALKSALNDVFLLEDFGVVVGSTSSDGGETEVSYGASDCNLHLLPPNGKPQLALGRMNGNFVLISRSIFKKVGPIYGGYSHGMGDLDYGYMVRRCGFNFYIASDFVGICPRQPERYLGLKNRTVVERARLLFAPKGYPLRDAVLFKYRNFGVLHALLSFAHIVTFVLCGMETSRHEK